MKLDGFRGTLYVERRHGVFRSKTVRVMMRFQPFADAIASSLHLKNVIFDGEIIVIREHSPGFYALIFRRGRPEYAAFDLLWLDGRDLRSGSYTQRKKQLQSTLGACETIGYVEDYREPELFEAATRLDLEGIVAKRSTDTYSETTEWLKVIHHGYTQADGRHELFER